MEERIEGKLQEAKGTVREGWGRLTDQPDVELRGQAEQMMGQTKQLIGTVKESVASSLQQVRADPAMRYPETRKAALKLLAYIAALLVILNGFIRGARRIR